MEYLRDEKTRNTRADFYMAQVALEIRRSWVKNPSSMKLKDFLIEFTQKSADTTNTVVVHKESPTKRMERSKAVWTTVLGLDPESTTKKKKK